ncbi:MAG: hypothetical protein JWP21_3050 [Tardiphaga sp.]|nr:hypothetical protein [Tardiphaga sp.]
MIVLLVAAIAALLAGVLAILIGIPVKEFSFGNTMILAGAMAMCTGLVLFGLWVTAREMRAVARRIASPASAGLHDPSLPELSAPPRKPSFPSRPPAREPAAVVPPVEVPPVYPPFPPDAIADRPSADAAPEPAPEPESKPKARRNLLFESSVRKDRERAAAAGAQNGAAAPAIETGQRTTFDDSGPLNRERPERALRARSPSTYPDTQAAAVSVSDVTVLKSGVVDGMAYSLYSDGSIEAQMPEGMMRFSSIEELRTHLDQRGA